MRLWNGFCFVTAFSFFCCWPVPARAGDRDPVLVPVPVPQKERLPLKLELIHWETPMGGGQPRPVSDAMISVDRTDVFALHLPAAALRPEAFKLHLVRIDFTLHPPEGRKRLKEVKLKISWKDPKASSLDVFPKRLDSTREVPRSLQVKTRQIQPRLDDAGPIAAEGLEPVVVGFQRGGKEASWILQGPGGIPLRPGPRRVFLLVRAPAENRTLKGIIHFEGTAENQIGDLWLALPKPRTDRRSLEVDLLGPAG